MAAAQMSFDEVYAQLEAWGTDKCRAIYARDGAGENQFGVLRGNLRTLAKKLKTNHPLAMQLWATANVDAQIVAAMIMDADQLSEQEAEAMVRSLTYHSLVDELVYNALWKAPSEEALRSRWVDSPEELIGRAGWALVIARIMKKDAEGLHFDAILQKIEAEVKAAPKRKQDAMNRCLCEIGIRHPELTQRCVEIGERLGRLDPNERVPKGCTSSYAPEWIAAGIRLREQRSRGAAPAG